MVLVVKNPPADRGCTRDMGSIPGSVNPLVKETATTPIFLPGKFHGQWSLAGYSSWAQIVGHD